MHHEVNYWHTKYENDCKYSLEKIIKPIIHWMAKYLHLKSRRGLYHAVFTTKYDLNVQMGPYNGWWTVNLRNTSTPSII
jgi:hypothetical protein